MKKSILAAVGGGIMVAGITGLWLTQSIGTSPTLVDSKSDMEQDEAVSKIKVIASFYPLYEFSKNIGGDKAEISSFIPVGIEPHDWDPSSGDILKLKEANVFVYNGAGFEPFVDQLIDSGEYGNVIFVDSSAGINLIKQSDEHNSGYNPHVWLDPILVKHQVTTIKDAMIQTDPKNAQYYETNANAYSAKLDELDAKIKSG
ncbi:MAG: metal ABC transporter substrate-binding protein, partial [Candidatus Nitrosotenuis sp.]